MRVILNVDAISAPLTGIGQYALQLARGLRQHREVEDIRFFSAYRWVDDPEQALAVNQPLARARRWAPFKKLALEAYTAARGTAFRWRARPFKGYVLHSPNYLLMPFDGTSVCTVHDLSYIRYPQYHPAERISLMERRMSRTLDQAAAIITDSAFVRREVIDILGVPADKVHCVHLGVDKAFRPRTHSELAPILPGYGLAPGGYLLAVSTLEPRKNLHRLLHAYARLAGPLRDRFPLVLVGTKGWMTGELGRELQSMERTGQVRWLGYVPQSDLPFVYAGAHVFAFPSLYEGFGLPVLEAMASGVPVLASEHPALQEVARGAALLVNAEDVGQMTTALERLLSDEELRATVIRRGIRRAQEFSWQRCVNETLQAYRRAAS